MRAPPALAFPLALLVAASAPAADWPMGRADARRSAASTEELPEELTLHWALELAALEPAWPDDPRLGFDAAYEPVVADGRVFVGSSREDSVLALELASGVELWRFIAGGPVRFAPAVWDGRVFFVADDGFLYSLDAASGELLWKVRGGPGEERAIGNGRLVSAWPARGAPVVAGGTVYFAASIWPFMGVFLHALDARSGGRLWTNEATDALYVLQPHASPAFAGLAPQGYLAAVGDSLLVPNGRAAAASLACDTGALRYFRPHEQSRTENFRVALLDGFYAHGDRLYELETGAMVPSVRIPPAYACDPDGIYGVEIERGEDAEGAPVERLLVRFQRVGWTLVLDTGEFTARWTDAERGCVRELSVRNGRVERLAERGCAGGGCRLEAVQYVPEPDYEDSSATRREAGLLYYLEARAPERGGRRARPRLACAAFFFDAAARRLAVEIDRSEGLEGPSTAVPGELAGAPLAGEETARERSGTVASGPPWGLRKAPEVVTAWTFADERRAPRVVAAHASAALQVIRSGSRLYTARPGELLAMSLPAGREGSPDAVAWRIPFEGTPGSLLAAGGKLLLATREGRLLCFGATGSAPLAERPARPAVRELPPAGEGVLSRVEALLERIGTRDGYAVVFGIGDGTWTRALVDVSSFHAIAIGRDPREVADVRRRSAADGAYGSRLVAYEGDISSFALPAWFAELVWVTGEAAADLEREPELVTAAFRAVRPWGGVLAVECGRRAGEALAARLAAAGESGLRAEHAHGAMLLARDGPLAGEGSWTHQYADAANTSVSRDRLVRLPLGIQWFGGPSNAKVLPRHGHGPRHHVSGGRIIIEGSDVLRALDVYSGRLLWEAELPGLGRAYDSTRHQPGANALGSNFCSSGDSIYVAYGTRCVRLDAGTGRRTGEIAPPSTDGSAHWGYLAVEGDVLLAGLSPAVFSSGRFDRFDLERIQGDGEKRVEELLESLEGFPLEGRSLLERRPDWLVRHLNRLLEEKDLSSRVPGDVRAGAGAEAVRAIQEELAAAGGPDPHDAERLVLANRRLLAAFYPWLPRPARERQGEPHVWDATASRRLAAFDRHTGDLLWSFDALHAFRHNAIALGGGQAFAADRLPARVAERLARRGKARPEAARLVALDLETGGVSWTAGEDVFGTFLSYSAEHDVLVESTRPSRDMLPDEPGERLAAYRGSTGEVLWRRRAAYAGPVMLHGGRIIAQGEAFDLLSGEDIRRTHPLTERETEWSFARHYGCGAAIASERLITFRSAAAGFFDLERDGGTGNFGGFRSSCTANLIAGGGVLAAPDYTRTCTCSYQNQSSLGLVHMPELEYWTFNALPLEGPIRRVGINFGAPGDRRADDGTLWLEHPAAGGPSPEVRVSVEPTDARAFRFHSLPVARDTGPQTLPWVASSGLAGVRKIVLDLGDEPADAAERRFTVRLHFLEPEGAAAGERVVSVRVQDAAVMDRLDVAREAGGGLRPLVRDVRGVRVRGMLAVVLEPAPGSREPVLSGIEAVEER